MGRSRGAREDGTSARRGRTTSRSSRRTSRWPRMSWSCMRRTRVCAGQREETRASSLTHLVPTADPTLRLHCKATLPHASAEDPTARLAFTLRKKRRLRISLTTSDGETLRTGPGAHAQHEGDEASADLRDILDAAQAEAFDEEIFAALQNEADQRTDLDARISVGKVTVQAGPSMELAFEMVGVRARVRSTRH